MKYFISFYFLSILIPSAYAQDSLRISSNFEGTRNINAHSVKLADKGKLMLLIQHRFGDISGGAYEFFGLDQASMRIGFEYGFGKNFNFGIGRSTYLKTFDGFGKVRFVQQNSNFPISIVATIGGSIPSIRDYFPDEFDNFPDKFSGNAQLHFAKSFKNFAMQLSPGYLKTGYLIEENANLSIFTLGFGGSVKISKKVSVNMEYLHPFNSELENQNPLSLGVDLDTGGHLFQLILSNSQQMFEQALFTNAIGDWTKGSLFFGFNLIREFNIKYYE